MKTVSVMLQNLCVPCECRCRYCLLSCDGKTVGTDWERGLSFARAFTEGLKKERPELGVLFSFGASMEHPRLPEALDELRALSSPQSEFLQCDGMKMRSDAECALLAGMLAEKGVKHLNFTFYGPEEYHDRFAGRRGDHALMLRMLRAAGKAGLELSVGIPVTTENVSRAEELIDLLHANVPELAVKLFIPHGEGRGRFLEGIRLSEEDLGVLSPAALGLLNRSVYRPEREWLTGGFYKEETVRTLIISLRADNIDRYEAMAPGAVVAEAEALDDGYYAAFPDFYELAALYGDPAGTKLYRQRDLFHYYRRRYALDHGTEVYDVTDERQTGSRRS
ncbi:MAG: hypothetical protein II155_05340 [Clostridia bacterium]|nr:hypothetical protein [Clostridia bacterium]